MNPGRQLSCIHRPRTPTRTSKGIFIGTVIAALSLLTSEAYAQAAFKCPAAGTQVELNNGARITWLASEGRGCRRDLRLGSGEIIPQIWFAPTFVGQPSRSLDFFEQTRPWALWPLTVGKKLSGRFDGPGADPGFTGSWLYTTTVEKFETYVTKTGAFEVFVVARKEEALGGTFKSTTREWYAPELGVSIRTTYSDNQGSLNGQEAVGIR
jgi:hypothetical protein